MLRLPLWVHDSWRPTFEHRWRRSRPLLVVGFGLTPLLVAGSSVGILASIDALHPPTFFAALALLLAPVPYLWWFLLAGRVAVSTDFWGTRIGLCGAVQVFLGLAVGLNAADRSLSSGLTLAVLAAVFVLAVLGGVAGWCAHRILLDDSGNALAVTDLSLEEPIWAMVGPTSYPGKATLDGTSLAWSVRRGGRFGGLLSSFHDRVRLIDILDTRVVRITYPERVPPVGYLSDGRPIGAPRGGLLVVRTRYREVGVPVMQPHRLGEQIRLRCAAIRSATSRPATPP